jgi:DNA-binding transcriptional ArsR family regulator
MDFSCSAASAAGRSSDSFDHLICGRPSSPPRETIHPAHIPREVGGSSRRRPARLRDIAATVGITERSAAQIVTDLEEAGYLTKTREGRRNRYELHSELPLRHPQHRHHTVGELIRFLQAPAPKAPSHS